MTRALEAHLWEQTRGAHRFFWHRLRWRVVAAHLPTGVPFELLDVGAGAGVLREYLGETFPQARYRFIEPIEPLERYLEDRYGVESNARDVPRYEGVDVVTLLDVLEHQEDDVGFLADLAGKMEPGARLILTVPALSTLWSGWDTELGHFRRYDKKTLAERFAGLPVVMEEMSYLFPELIPAIWLRKIARRPSRDGRGQARHSDFPRLPGWLNDLLYLLGTPSVALRRRWPVGTSLFAVARRR